MGLSLYKKKRNFGVTTEPTGKTKEKKGALIFVVQKHHASHLHYDFRLELDGVLKSWAVPKGPSLNPDDKRLAMMVEDHPYDYKDFEGNIPEGSYGGGNVIVWDNGTYHVQGETDKELNEKALRAGLKKGHLNFILHGKKLKGEFALVKIKNGRQQNAWLLFKAGDKYASKKDITKKDKSVISRVTLETLAKKYGNEKTGVVKTERVKKKEPVKKAAIKKVVVKKTVGKKKPALIKPMLAKLTEAPFDDVDWVFEVKYDGYRALAACDGDGGVELYSRNLLSFNKDFVQVVTNLEKIGHSCLLDGEVVVEDKNGLSHFQLLQNYQNTQTGELKYYVFDILNMDGNDVTHLPLVERKQLLKLLLKGEKLKNVFYSDHVAEKGLKFFDLAVKNGLEGIIAKDGKSPYRVDKRSSEWLKIKITREQEAVIAGITEPKGARNHFGSLLLGVYNNGVLEYIGNCGTGFDEKTLKELYKKFEPLFTTKSPFKEKVKVAGKVHWLKPKLVCQVKFTEWTGDGSMRHPVFLGLRKDKKATEVKREIPEDMKDKKNKTQKTSSKETTGTGDVERKFGKIVLKLTNQQKLYWPEEKITKGDLIKYYDEVSGLILPYLKDRPESMHRFPNGIKDEGFYQKDVDTEKIPKWLKTEQVYSESNNKNIDYLVCNDKATLLYMVNLGCIEINPWNSRIQHPENPDWLVIDLDPEDIAFKEVVRAAQETKKLLDKLEIDSYCKTSGATGLHIFVPLAAKYDYDIAKDFAQLVAQKVNEVLPDTTSVLRMPAKRKKKVYLDFLQNRRGQTLAAPYSARPKPGATVSTPLEWDEVNAKLDPTKFTIETIFKRLDKVGDLWKPVLGKAANLDKAIKRVYEGL